jgi:hypothetical protein
MSKIPPPSRPTFTEKGDRTMPRWDVNKLSPEERFSLARELVQHLTDEQRKELAPTQTHRRPRDHTTEEKKEE